MTKRRATIAAFGISPLVTPLVFCLDNILTDHLMRFSISDVITNLVVGCMYCLPFAYAAEFVFGVPMWAIFRRFRIRSRSAFALGGALIGLAVAVLTVVTAKGPGYPARMVDERPFCVHLCRLSGGGGLSNDSFSRPAQHVIANEAMGMLSLP
jgi:peptidoglycan/LPS O-acetylase OafA/YrhL